MMVKLSDVFDLQMGKTPSRNNNTYWTDGEYDWISISDLGNYEKYVSSTKEKITELAIKESGIKKVPSNTLIMSFKLSVGKTAISKDEVYTNEAIMAFIPNNKYDVYTDYFYHLFSGKDWSKDTNRAVMGATLNKSTLGQIKVKIPPLEEQRKIAETLDKVSDLINKRKQQLEKLDLLVKSKFVEMFGDPINNTYNILTKPMNEVCEIIDGDRGENYPKQDEFSNDGYCLFLNAKNVTSRGFLFDSCMFISKEKDLILRKGKLKRGDVVLTTRGTLGNLAYYDDSVEYDNIRINSGMVILRMKKNIVSEKFFIEQFKMKLDFIKEKIASGSAQPQLPISTMNKIFIVVPSIELQNQFADFVKQTEKTKTIINQSLEKLETLKKALMQEYFG